ncbi:cation diffusion facilitator family transporter [Agromyces sp. ZXT2-3]|uniref:cation diffusion facilitator family transporter n=1 Tax=Agromyces sp. ZXT2-3 TaxID=3461152 RepID=UPI004054C510
MAHSHDHAPDPTAASRRRLGVAIAIIGAFVVVQVVGGLLTGSLALLADAGHMTSDLLGLVGALGAAIVAARPANDRQTYGFRRFEVFGALFNGVLLVVVAVAVTVSAVGRLAADLGGGAAASGDAHEVAGGPMLVIAILGLLANIAALLVLRGGARESLNMRGAYLEVLGDTIGSALVIAAAVVILVTGWDAADPIASLLIAALIVPRAIMLLRDVMHVLSQSVPAETDVAEIRDHILGTRGVVAVHDVHVWAITTGAHVFSAHVEVEPAVFAEGRVNDLLDELGGCLSEHFDVGHSTFQLEPSGRGRHETASHA